MRLNIVYAHIRTYRTAVKMGPMLYIPMKIVSKWMAR